jgi:hypothetical protein
MASGSADVRAFAGAARNVKKSGLARLRIVRLLKASAAFYCVSLIERGLVSLPRGGHLLAVASALAHPCFTPLSASRRIWYA